MRRVVQPPKAGSLVEAMRAIGYSLETSLADLIDNSIAAGASFVDIAFKDRRLGNPYVAIVDDGHGMDEDALVEAMRHGSSDPLSERRPTDLGRFGLGMKTASQAQCRVLTVISRRHSEQQPVAARWDIDLIRKQDSWELQILSSSDLRDPASGVPPELLIQLDRMRSGTIVLWQNLDRLSEPLANDGAALAERIGDCRDYLGLVFHRFIDGPAQRVSIRMNSAEIQAHDPFLIEGAPPWSIGSDEISVAIDSERCAKISYEAYVLPGLDRLTPTQIQSLTASGGLRKGQGFYVYRAHRLLVWGTWFRIVKQHELSKLARIKIDVPNSLDKLWALDIRKSTAVPPAQIRDALNQAVARVHAHATKATRRYGVHRRQDSAAVWRHLQVDAATFRFEVNADHPVIVTARNRLGDDAAACIDDLLEMIAEALPYNDIYVQMAGDRRPPPKSEISEELVRLANDTVNQLTATGLTREQAVQLLMRTEPFSNHEDFPTMVAKDDTHESN
jgi:hypothetical protein